MTRIKFKTFDTINAISQKMWDSFVDNSQISIQYDHLKAIEESKINNHNPYYVLIYGGSESEYIGIAYYCIIDLDMSQVSNSIKQETIKIIKHWDPSFLKVKMLESGLLTGLGQTFHIHPAYEKQVLPLLIKEIEDSAQSLDVDLILFRDIEQAGYQRIGGVFKAAEYQPIVGFSTAIMDISWISFDEYINSLKSDRRRSVLKQLSKINTDEITIETIVDFEKYIHVLTQLWKNVNEKATSYSHEQLNNRYFTSINKWLQNSSHIIAIKLHGQIVAYALCFVGEKEYFFDFVGVNYEFNKQYDLYFNLYYAAIKEAINRGMSKINFGITTYDCKLRMGSKIVPYIYCIKANKDKSLTCSIADLFSGLIEKPLSFHRVFKDQKNEEPIDLTVLNNELLGKIPENNDIFKKAKEYHRINQARVFGYYCLFPEFESAQSSRVIHNGRELIMLGSNSYLGLANDERIQGAAIEAIKKYGTGCSGSPTMNGTLDIHKKLADELKSLLQKEDCIVFSTGYQTNLGVIGTLADSSDMVVLDEYSHASLIDGALFSKAKIARYRHNDLEYLEKLLDRYSDKSKLVVADSVYSMEGTVVDLPQLVHICKKHNTRLVLDEAHAIGVYGQTGGGLAEHYGLQQEVDLITGTFSKSCASVGGFVAGNKTVVDFLRSTSRSHLFSASLPPASVATVIKAIEIFKSEPERRSTVIANARYVAEGLSQMGYEIEYNNTAIVPVFCRNELITIALYKKLLSMGVYVNPVLYPAVPKGGELLRTSYLATHKKDDLDKVLEIFDAVRNNYFPEKRKV